MPSAHHRGDGSGQGGPEEAERAGRHTDEENERQLPIPRHALQPLVMQEVEQNVGVHLQPGAWTRIGPLATG